MIVGSKPIGTVAYMGGVPAVLEEFCWSWGQMIQYNQEILCKPTEYVHLDRVKYSDHGPARNALAERFLGDWLLMLDTDHRFEPDLVARLLRLSNLYEVDVVSGLYRFKKSPCSPVAFHEREDALQPIAEWDESVELLAVSATGAGCLFVRRGVYDQIRFELKEKPFDRLEGFSEDHSFFKRLKRLGVKPYLAARVESYHLRVTEVGREDQELADFPVSENFAVEGFKQ